MNEFWTRTTLVYRIFILLNPLLNYRRSISLFTKNSIFFVMLSLVTIWFKAIWSLNDNKYLWTKALYYY